MIEDCELDSIPKLLELGKMTKKEAVMKIMQVVYTNPGRFNLLDMDEDERSDFLLDAFKRFDGLLDRYKKSVGSLGAYIYYSISGIKMTWARKKGEELSIKRAIRRDFKNIYENALEKSERLAKANDDLMRLKDAGMGGSDEPLVFTRILGRRSNYLETKEIFYKKRAAFVLALKSAWYLDDKKLGAICDYCKLPQKSFFKTAFIIKRSLVERSEKRAKIEEMRDKAWLFVCKYREELARLDPKCERFKLVKKRLEYQLNSWKNKNKILQSYQLSLSPRNKDLAKMLKIKSYRLSVFLNYAKKMAAAGETLFPEREREDE
ncbi:MAG: hypothetical protein J6V90_05660 [Treponema sp.]|nr:hypothetical protein [Treponema sp.]